VHVGDNVGREVVLVGIIGIVHCIGIICLLQARQIVANAESSATWGIGAVVSCWFMPGGLSGGLVGEGLLGDSVICIVVVIVMVLSACGVRGGEDNWHISHGMDAG